MMIKKEKKYIAFVLNYFFQLILLIFLTSCEYGIQDFLHKENSVEKRSSQISHLEFAKKIEKDVFTVVVLSDIHVGNNASRDCDDVFFDWMEMQKKNDTLPEFCIFLGDVADHGYQDEFLEFKEVFQDRLLNDYGVQAYSVIGNHDTYNNGSVSWKNIIYPHTFFYHFQAGGVGWYFLDSGDASLGKTQADILIDEIKKDKSKKVIISHYPLFGNNNFYFVMQNSIERNLLLKEFANNNVCVILEGHIHDRVTSDFGVFKEEVIPSLFKTSKWCVLTIGKNGLVSIE